MKHTNSLCPSPRFGRRKSHVEASSHVEAASLLNKTYRSTCDLPIQSSLNLNAQQPDKKASNHFKQRTEKSGLVLASIVLTFLVCHTFRMVKKVYEVIHPSSSTEEIYHFCAHHGR